MATDTVQQPIPAVASAPEPAEAAPTISTPPLPPRTLEENQLLDPQTASLHAIFPDFDPTVLQSVLHSVGGNQDRAVDMLLGMSDPDFKDNHVPDQTELDEQLARRLMLEDQEQHREQRRWQAPAHNVPYQPREHAPDAGARVQGAETGKPDFQEVTETFNKIAESGKRTFNSLFSKVKAKMQEFDQPRPDPNTTASGSQFSSGPPPSDRHSMMQQQQSYYDPSSQVHESPTPAPPQVQGYDLTSVQSSPQPVTSTSPISLGASPISHPAGFSTSPPPSNIDPSKIGLLPKRPVSLISASPPPKTAAAEDDELEYVENPFEDDQRRK